MAAKRKGIRPGHWPLAAAAACCRCCCHRRHCYSLSNRALLPPRALPPPSPQADDSSAVVAVGDAIPAGITLDFGFPPEKIDLAARCNKKNIILLGLPGAFTPT